MSNCNCCCTHTLKYCNQDICDEIDFDIKAQVDGTHKLITYFLGKKVTILKDFSIGDNLIFPLSGLNENYEYTVELFDPNNAKVLIRKDDTDYDCFNFSTTINMTINYVMES